MLYCHPCTLACEILDIRKIHIFIRKMGSVYYTEMHESRVQGKCIAKPTKTTSFSKEKGAALGGTRTHDTLLSRQSALLLSLLYNTT